MNFLYPAFLFGLASLAIPVIIHLFNFRRTKTLFFSSTRFLQQINTATSKKRQLKHILVLISRMLFLLFLTLAFAQPYLPGLDKNPLTESVYIYLDNSPSMTNRADGNSSALDVGIDYINQLTKLYPTNTSYKLLTNDFAPFSNSLKSKNEIETALTTIRRSNVSRTLEEAYSRLKSDNLLSIEEPKDLYIISDFQRSAIGDLANFSFDSLDQVFVVPISFEGDKNIFVDTVYLSNPYLVASEKNQLNVVLKNVGSDDVTDLPMKIYINGLQAISSVVGIAAGRTREFSFETTFSMQPVNSCRISIDDYPVTFDNDFFFVMRIENKINILEIRESSSRTSVESVYGNEALFNFTSQTAANTNYSLIRQQDLVILNSLTTIENSIATELANFLQAGGTLLIIPGVRPDINSYRQLLPELQPASPSDTTMVSLAIPELNDPFYENVFEGTADNLDMPAALPVMTWSGQQTNLLRLRNNQSFLAGFKRQGTIYMMATALDNRYTNFHRHALFVPVMYRLATMSKRGFDRLYYNINDPLIELTLDSLHKQDIFNMTDVEAETEFIPDQRITDKRLILELPRNTMEPGFYNVRLGDQVKYTLAFNHDKNESVLDQYSSDEINKLFNKNRNVRIIDATDTGNFSKEVKKNKFGVPLWKYAVIMSLIFLLAEILLIRFL